MTTTMPSQEQLDDLVEMGAPMPYGSPEFLEWMQDDLGQDMLITIWTLLAVCNVFVGLRLYVRLRVYERLLRDDYWLLGALFCGTLSAALATIAVNNGNGQHMPSLSYEQQSATVMWTTATFCPGIMFFGLPKVAIVILLVRLLDPSKWIRRMFWIMLSINQAAHITLIGLLLGRCNPPAHMWDPRNVAGDCLPEDVVVNFALFTAAFSAFIDVALAVYPVLILIQTPMMGRRKLGLCIVLGTGAIGGGIAIYKTVIIPDALTNLDFSYHSARLIIWTAVEGSTHIMAACMPIIAPLADLIMNGGNPFSRSKRTDKSYNQFKNSTSSPGMESIAYYQSAAVERGADAMSESQVDMLPMTKPVHTHSHSRSHSQAIHQAMDEQRRAGAATPLPGPGEILCTNEINVTYERRKPMEPLEAMVRGYDSTTWKDW